MDAPFQGKKRAWGIPLENNREYKSKEAIYGRDFVCGQTAGDDLLFMLFGGQTAVHGGIQLFQGKPSADILGDLLVIAACSFAGIVFISILFPIFYKFGVNKSRLIMILAFAIPSALAGAGMALLGESGVTLRFSPVFLHSLPFLLIAIVLLGLWLSVSISTRILENKEY